MTKTVSASKQQHHSGSTDKPSGRTFKGINAIPTMEVEELESSVSTEEFFEQLKSRKKIHNKPVKIPSALKLNEKAI